MDDGNHRAPPHDIYFEDSGPPPPAIPPPPPPPESTIRSQQLATYWKSRADAAEVRADQAEAKARDVIKGWVREREARKREQAEDQRYRFFSGMLIGVLVVVTVTLIAILFIMALHGPPPPPIR